jgi:hypothetical protein
VRNSEIPGTDVSRGHSGFDGESCKQGRSLAVCPFSTTPHPFPVESALGLQLMRPSVALARTRSWWARGNSGTARGTPMANPDT